MESLRTDTNEDVWRIDLLGDLQAQRGSHRLTHFQTQKTAVLLAYLASYPQTRHTRERLIDLLWPEAEPQAGRNRLSQALSWLRLHLEDSDRLHGRVLLADRYSLGLNPEHIVTDVNAFDTALRNAEHAPQADRIAMLQRAAEAGQGEFLAGYYEDWILVERRRLQTLWLTTAQRLTAHYEGERQWESALDLARRALASEPLDEAWNTTFARLLAASGQPSAALRHLRAWERTLDQELGDTLSEAARALVEQIRQMPPSTTHSLPSTPLLGSPARPVPQTPAPSLPTPLTRFFGREAEMEQIRTLIVAEQARLITLTGLGGSGKTRLAIEAAARLSAVFPQAVLFAPLADLNSARHMLDRLADLLHLSRSSATALSVDLQTQVAEALASRPCLLILDNMEHLMPEVTEIVRDLLARAPLLNVLVTSRQLLGLEGEREIPLPPLSVPMPALLSGSAAEHAASGALEITASVLAQIDSVRLFVDRAQASRPSFQVTARNARDVAQLCARLEGLPLALELCAAWAQTLSPAQMLAQLARRFDLLVSRRADIAPRHRTLRAALEYSYLLLPPPLQQMFVRLSVFRGGWTLEAAHTVCTEAVPSPVPSSAIPASGVLLAPVSDPSPPSQVATMLPTLTALTELRERSLILVEEAGDAGETMRFRMLETLREFAREQQTLAVETEIRQRHALYFLHLAETSQPHLSGAQQRDWLWRLEADHDNLRQALAWATATGSPTTGLRLGIALTSFWDTRGYASEGQEWLARLLALQQEETSNPEAQTLRAKALNSCALLARSLARFAEAERYVASALELWRELDNASGRTVSLQLLATLAYSRENYTDARRLAEEALALTEQTGDAAGAAGARTNLGNIAMEQRRWDDAWELFSESLRQHQADGNLKRAANALNNLGLTARYRGDLRTARALLEQSLAICRDLADKSGTAISLLNLGAVARLEGSFDTAHTALEEATLLAIESDSKRALAWCARERGHLACAEHAFETGMRLLAAAEDLKLALGMSFNPADPEELTQCSAQARVALGDSAFDALWTSGMLLPLAEAYRKVTTLLNAPTIGKEPEGDFFANSPI